MTATARSIGPADRPDDVIALDYEDRFLRRKRLTSDGGRSFLVDLAQTTSVEDGQAFVLDDGTAIAVVARPEPLYRVTGDNLARIAWHVGNRHTPAQIGPDHILIQRDPVIGHMLAHVGAALSEVVLPFTPEGGAYGHGRTHAHDHGHTAHDHTHDHALDHAHEQARDG